MGQACAMWEHVFVVIGASASGACAAASRLIFLCRKEDLVPSKCKGLKRPCHILKQAAFTRRCACQED